MAKKKKRKRNERKREKKKGKGKEVKEKKKNGISIAAVINIYIYISGPGGSLHRPLATPWPIGGPLDASLFPPRKISSSLSTYPSLPFDTKISTFLYIHIYILYLVTDRRRISAFDLYTSPPPPQSSSLNPRPSPPPPALRIEEHHQRTLILSSDINGSRIFVLVCSRSRSLGYTFGSGSSLFCVYLPATFTNTDLRWGSIHTRGSPCASSYATNIGS